MSPLFPKNPRRPRVPLTLPAETVKEWTEPLWRIHTVTGKHPLAWNALRWDGPISSMRWDPHKPPFRKESDTGVSYVSPDFATCFAEVFQSSRKITLTTDRVLSGWKPARPLQLLNLLGGNDTGDWAVKHQASASLPQAPKRTCRGWAHEIEEQLGDQLDGLLVPSTVLGDQTLVLFTRAQDSFPSAPTFSRNLTHDTVRKMAMTVKARLTWPIR